MRELATYPLAIWNMDTNRSLAGREASPSNPSPDHSTREAIRGRSSVYNKVIYITHSI